MSNYKTVFFTLGILQIILGIFMFIPVGVQFLYNEIDSSFFGASIVTIIFGTLFFLSNLDHNKKLNLQSFARNNRYKLIINQCLTKKIADSLSGNIEVRSHPPPNQNFLFSPKPVTKNLVFI